MKRACNVKVVCMVEVLRWVNSIAKSFYYLSVVVVSYITVIVVADLGLTVLLHRQL